MKRISRGTLAMILLTAFAAHGATRLPFSNGWEFHLGDFDGPTAAAGGEAPWRELNLPHDWSIEHPTDPAATSGGGGGYFITGTGWYRKRFAAAPEWREHLVEVYFEGAYRNAEVWLNGHYLGAHAYGYTPFRRSLGEHLRRDAPNELLVRVENEPQPNSRWYSGSGLYRPVWLEVRPVVHFAPESLFVTTRALEGGEALLAIEAVIANADQLRGDERVEFALLDASGEPLANIELAVENRRQRATVSLSHLLPVSGVSAWSPATPVLHPFRARLFRGDERLEETTLRLGLRTLRWSSQGGFELNGEPLLFFGGNVHHDNGPLGAAAHPEAEWRKAALLKAAGFNAVRTAHNPPSEAFLHACDRLGLLVIDESFDMWRAKKTAHDYAEIFDDNWEEDLRAMVRRDRNHPSVVMWSIGNEVYERGNDNGVRLAHAMAAVVRQLDRSRPVTIGLNGLGESGDWTRLDAIFDGLDLAGYNYELHRHAEDFARRPNRVIYSSESYLTDAFAYWKLSQEHPHIVGDFVWSAIDYLGEAGIGRVFPPDEEARAHWVGEHYPWHGAYCGDIDLIGWRKPISHYRNIVWDAGERLHAAVLAPTPDGRPWNLSQWAIAPSLPTWTWPVEEGRPLTLEVSSRYPSVRVSLDGELVGEARTGEAEAFKASFTLPYRPGRLEITGGEERIVLETAGEPAHLALYASDPSAWEGPRWLHFVEVEIHDAAGRWQPWGDRPVSFSLPGGRILAVGSGDLTSTESYQANPRRTFRGRALVVCEVNPFARGLVHLTAEAEGLEPAQIRLR
jgi:beta-galactosidase